MSLSLGGFESWFGYLLDFSNAHSSLIGYLFQIFVFQLASDYSALMVFRHFDPYSVILTSHLHVYLSNLPWTDVSDNGQFSYAECASLGNQNVRQGFRVFFCRNHRNDMARTVLLHIDGSYGYVPGA